MGDVGFNDWSWWPTLVASGAAMEEMVETGMPMMENSVVLRYGFAKAI